MLSKNRIFSQKLLISKELVLESRYWMESIY
jgi:hypothetical protein